MKKMVGVIVLVILLAGTSACADDKLPLPVLDEAQLEPLRSFLEKHGLAPDAFVISKFEHHDVVILGENHRIKHQVGFIQTLVPKLYEAGVYAIATEFGRREDQALIDSVLTAPEYDEAMAREIVFRQFVHWGFREYVDMYKAAWELNNKLPADARKFRILGVNDSPDWSHVKTTEDRDRDEVKKKVWEGCGEHLWARAVLDYVEKGEKILVYCGMHHGFTEFQQPLVNGAGEFTRMEDRRMGTYIFNEIGKRAITIYMHGPWTVGTYGGPYAYPADGHIDALMANAGGEYYPVGFDTRGTPFGDLSCENSTYGTGYDNLTLGTYCDGYIFFKPLSQHEGVALIPDFVNNDNIERARANSWDPRFRKASPMQFYASAYQAANIKHKYRKLH